jgi:hypothetical protein
MLLNASLTRVARCASRRASADAKRGHSDPPADPISAPVSLSKRRLWRWLRRMLTVPALAAALVGAAATPAFASASYGFSFANAGQAPTYIASSAWEQIFKPDLPVTHVRFFVPWDAVSTYSGGTCVASPDTEDAVALQSAITAATSDGLSDILVSITKDSEQHNSATSGDVLTSLGPAAYNCGVTGLLSHFGSEVPEWEPWNEPNVSGAPAVSAQYYTDFASDAQNASVTPTIVAGALSSTSLGDEQGNGQTDAAYINDIEADADPAVFSIHPYTDVTCSGSDSVAQGSLVIDHRQTEDFVSALQAAAAANGHAMPQVWVTEAGVELGSNDSQGCNATDAENESAQVYGASAFYGLSSEVPAVTREYWYEWQTGGTNNQPDTFDSALFTPGGNPRPSFCELVEKGPLASAVSNCPVGQGVEVGTVRSDAGTLWAVGNMYEPLSIPAASQTQAIEEDTAGWNTCSSGYSLVGYEFSSAGFWLCAQASIANQTFYVGNANNDQATLFAVAGGQVTQVGAAGGASWNECPAGTGVLGYSFQPNGFWVCAPS